MGFEAERTLRNLKTCIICRNKFNSRRKYCDDDCSRIVLFQRRPELIKKSILVESTIHNVKAKQSVNDLFDDKTYDKPKPITKSDKDKLFDDIDAMTEFNYRQYAKKRMEDISKGYY